MSTLESGTDFAGHRIERELGRGGMGIVYRALHLSLEQPRALKVLAPRLGGDVNAGDRFRKEARLAASIDHPAVVRVHDAGEQDGQLFISMQLVDGVDLGVLLAAGSLSPRRCVAILAQVAAGLDAAHAAGLVHRDVKPENVLVGAEQAGVERALLGDFGIGLLASGEPGSRLTAESQVLGTADYIAPEQIEAREVSPAADVYSLACMAFRMLTGRVPFPAETSVGTLLAHRSAPRPSARDLVPELPPDTDAVLASGMAIDPAERPASAGELVRRLDRALGDTGALDAAAEALTMPLPDVRREKPAEGEGAGRSSRGRRPLLIGGAASIAAAAVALLLVIGGSDSGDVTEQPASVSFDVPRNPVSVAPGANYVWVVSAAAGQVTAFDAETGEKSGLRYEIEHPRAAAIGPGYVWVVTADSLLRLAVDGSDIDRADVELTDATDVAVDPEGIWVLNRGPEPEAIKVNPDSLEVAGRAFVGAEPQGLDAGPGAVWVTNTGDGTVTEIDPDSAQRIGSPIDVGGRPSDIAAGGGQVWVIDNLNGLLIPIDTSGSTPVPGAELTTLPQPRGIALGYGSVWVASGQDGVLERFSDSGEHELEASFTVGADPAEAARGSNRIWTADSASRTVSGVDP